MAVRIAVEARDAWEVGALVLLVVASARDVRDLGGAGVLGGDAAQKARLSAFGEVDGIAKM